MKITKHQYDHYLQLDEEKFIDLILEHLGIESPELVVNLQPAILREMIANGLAKARGYGINIDNQLIGFISIMFSIAPNFDEQADINKILNSTSIPADEKFDLIFEDDVSEQAWAEAEDHYDDLAWFPELREQDN